MKDRCESEARYPTAASVHNLIYKFASIAFIAIFVSLISLINGTWFNYPGGVDTYGHLTKIRYILEFWPNSEWGFIWAGGMPLFRWYPPLPYYSVALLVKAVSVSIEFALNLVFLASIATTGAMVYLTTQFLTEGDHLTSVAVALLTTTSPSFWNYGVAGGMYNRIVAIAIFSFYLYFLVKYLSHRSNSRSRLFIALTLTFMLSVLSHPWIWVLLALSTIITPALCVRNIRPKLRAILGISFPSLLLSAYYLIPFFFYTPETLLGLSPFSFEPAPTSYTLSYSEILDIVLGLGKGPNRMSLLIVPMLVSLLILSWVLRRTNKSKQDQFARRIAISYALISCILILIPAVKPTDPSLLLFLVIYLPLLSGFLLHRLVGPKSEQELRHGIRIHRLLLSIRVMLLVAIVLFALTWEYPVTSISFKVNESGCIALKEVDELLVNQTGNSIANYRFGVPDASVAVWFNYKYPYIPQTRDYMATSVLNRDMVFWFSLMVWGGKGADKFYTGLYPETNFLLDWFAVKWFVMYPPHNFTKFLSAPNYYDEVTRSEDGVFHGFIYKYATPIIAPTNVPAVLVIGSYDQILRSFAYADYDSRRVIPIYGGQFIDDFTISELQKFGVVLLYGYEYHDFEKSWELLRNYVENGGGLIIDTGYSPEINAPRIPLPSPVSSTLQKNFGKEWRFSQISSYVTNGVNFSSFSPAIYEGGPWGVSAAMNESVRDWARAVLWDNGYPVVAIGEHGRGRVVWCGLNLPWHILTYQNFQESLLLGKFIEWASGTARDSSIALTSFRVDRENPENVAVIVEEEARGVLFKEFDIANWKAILEDATGKRIDLKIYKAGPGFMYVSLPKGFSQPLMVLLKYRTTSIEYLGDYISLATLLALVLYGLSKSKARSIEKLRRVNMISYLLKKVKRWWYREG